MSPAEQMALNRWIERRDPEAFQSIVSAYSGMVYGACRRSKNRRKKIGSTVNRITLVP